MFAPDDYYRIEAEFLTLAGGDAWDRVEQLTWAWRQRDLAERRVAERERWRSLRAKPAALAYVNQQRRARYRAAAECVVAVRGCAECGALFGLVEARRRLGRDQYCSRSCSVKATVRRHGMHTPNAKPVFITIDGVTRERHEWARHFGITLQGVRRRVKRGMSLVDAFRAPKAPTRTRLVTIAGETLPLKAWAERKGLSIEGVYRRMRQDGLSEVEALTRPKWLRRKRGAA